MTNYTTPVETAQLTRQATPDELWLAAQLGRINPHADEMGNDGEYIRALETLVFELRDDAKRKDRAAEVYAYERDHARAYRDSAVRILMGIHALLYQAPLKLEDGRTMVFRPKYPDPHKILQELSDRIRAIPDEIASMRVEQSIADHEEDVLNMVKAAEPVAREPLSNDAIESLLKMNHFSEQYQLKESDRTIVAWYRIGLRDGELAHGITPTSAKGST